ncbi:hypothetical protein Tco_0940106 [Tanacetum coccineum]|uniref:Uncharacterized protein n=1 Tax=Tanacetum coccineum TaxID=301880 RepID=A0ABQ5DM07_9ASTR
MGSLSTKEAASSTPFLLALPVMNIGFHLYCKDVFSPRRSPIGNLACLLNVADDRIGFTYEPRMLPRWRAVEDDKALYLQRIMTIDDDESAKESVPNKECMSGIHEKVVPKKVTVRERDLVPRLDLMRGNPTASSEYYYHVMRDAEQLNQFLKSIEGGLQTPISGKTIDLSISRLVSHYTKNPQAVYIIIALGGRDTDNPFGGYAIEIFFPDKLYKLEDGKVDQTSEFWTITIPKKKDDCRKLTLFSREKNLETNPVAANITA